jgi:hypothetical protein
MAPTLKGRVSGCGDITGPRNRFVWYLEAFDAVNEPEVDQEEGIGRTEAEWDPIMVSEAGHH